ncbi:MAG: hypothetical protein IJD10_04340, partial [Clostridia bacterium]|nr:hypothetical protein [Clostridia bacterium]
MSQCQITLKAPALPFFGVAHKGGRKTLEIQAFDGAISITVQYDYHRDPLTLCAPVAEGDKVEVILLHHRIELRINGEVKDEEWPKGLRLFEVGDSFFSDFAIEVVPCEEKKTVLPSVLGTFENAEGWYPGNGVFVGDCMPYRKDDEYHVLYLKDRHHHQSKWMLGAHQWEHISTKDFKTWKIHPMAVPITDPAEGSICTGSWIREGGKEYLYYTVRRGDGIPAPICRSVSEDGYHFEKDETFRFTLSERYDGVNARDPKVVKGEDGLFHVFLTTAMVPEGRGCLAHYVSADMETWEDAGAPIYSHDRAYQPECPDYFVYRGKYYLVYSLWDGTHYA